jgi:hypothetical protein
MSWVEWALALGIFFPLLLYSFLMVNREVSSRSETPKIFEIKSIALDYFQKIFKSFGSPYSWNSTNWEEIGLASYLYRIPILVEENASLNRELEPVDIHLILDEDCENRALNSTIRLFSEGREIPFDLHSIVYCSPGYIKEANLVFFANVSANSSSFYYLYFSNDTSIKSTSYPTDLIYSNYLENSKIRLNLTGEVSEIYNLQTSSPNLLAGRNFGIVQYNLTTNNLQETNETSGTKSLIIDSNFKKVVQISGSKDWYDYKINITLYAYQNYFIFRSWVKEKVDVVVHDFKNPEANLYSSFENIAFRNQSGIFVSSSLSGNVPNASWIAPYNSSGVDSLAILTKNYSSWQEAGWNNSGKDFSFSHILNEYDDQTLSLSSGQEIFGDEVFVFPFKSTSYSEVENFWKKISNPLIKKVYPAEKILAISAGKLAELKKINYTEAKKALGGYDFRIEIS